MSNFRTRHQKEIEQISDDRLEKILLSNDAVIYEKETRPDPVYKKITFPVPESKRSKFSDYIDEVKNKLKFVWIAASPEENQKARQLASAYGDIYKGWLATIEDPDRAVLASMGYDGELASFVYDENDDKARLFALSLAIAANAYEDIADTDDIRRWPKDSQQERMFIAKHGKSSHEFCMDRLLFDLCDEVRFTVETFGDIDTYGWQRLRRRTIPNKSLENYYGMKTPDDLECAALFYQLDNIEKRAIPFIIANSTTAASDPKMRQVDVKQLNEKRTSAIMQAASGDTALFNRRKGDLSNARKMVETALLIEQVWQDMEPLTEQERALAIEEITMMGSNPQFLPERIRAVALLKNVDTQIEVLKAQQENEV